jgi:transcriptional regulator with XRE-family HTH domain
MPKTRVYSQYTKEAASLLGQLIRIARKKRRWSVNDLTERVGMARETLLRIERGDPTCSLGLVFEAASIVGVPLFGSDQTTLATHLDRTAEVLALLPKTVRKSRKVVDDDF